VTQRRDKTQGTKTRVRRKKGSGKENNSGKEVASN